MIVLLLLLLPLLLLLLPLLLLPLLPLLPLLVFYHRNVNILCPRVRILKLLSGHLNAINLSQLSQETASLVTGDSLVFEEAKF